MPIRIGLVIEARVEALQLMKPRSRGCLQARGKQMVGKGHIAEKNGKLNTTMAAKEQMAEKERHKLQLVVKSRMCVRVRIACKIRSRELKQKVL